MACDLAIGSSAWTITWWPRHRPVIELAYRRQRPRQRCHHRLGTLGDHGIALLSFREGYGFETEVKSDIAPLNRLIEDVLKLGER